MSQLGDIESAIVTALTDATLGGEPLFASVRGAGGPVRPALRQALSRERMPACYVVFLNEKLTPEEAATEKGPRYAILLGDRTLRQGSDPRQGGLETTGVFELIAQARIVLDDFAPVTGRILKPLAQHIVESDERQTIGQITYIVRSS